MAVERSDQLHFNVLLQLVYTALAVAASNSSPRIQTLSGIYVGVTDTVSQIDSFKGIRYAEAPKRFSPARYPTWQQSKTELNAVNFGDDCPQSTSIPGVEGFNLGPPLRANQSEDCLFLNIWRPSARSTMDSLPVVIYIHGGGFFAGSGSEWDGTGFIRRSVITKKPVIFISINYRLGSLGFLGSAQMPIESLNLGLQDQRLAFRWIQENAKAFGGDPNRITIMGESAGGVSVHMHYLYPDSKHNFRAGISDSGTALGTPTPSCDFNDVPGGPYTVLGNLTGCGSGQGSFQCMQDLPFEAFWQPSLAAPSSGLPRYLPCKGPKGSFIEEYPAKKVIAGDFLDLPLITGANSNEGTLLTAIATQFLDIPQPPIEIKTAIFSAFVSAQTVNGKNLSQATIGNITALFPHMEPRISNSSLYERAAGFLTDVGALVWP
ncbi:Carboxylesterase [Mycena floridula]|nr:Carboxylesterase [Mycena floridula]